MKFFEVSFKAMKAKNKVSWELGFILMKWHFILFYAFSPI